MIGMFFRGLLQIVSKPSVAPVPPDIADAGQELIKTHAFRGGDFGPFGGNYCAETPEVRNRYREMLSDPTVKASVLSKVWDVATLDLQVAPDDPDNERDKLIADFNRDNVLNAKGGLRALVESIALGALMDGYSLCHKRLRDPSTVRGKWAGKLMLDALRPKDAGYYELQFNEYLTPVGVIDILGEAGKNALPLDQFVLVRHLQFFDSPLGMSDFRAADRAYCSLKIVQQLRAYWLEKWKGPFLHGKCDDSVERQQLADKLAKARAAGYITTDKDTEIDMINLATGGESAFQAACSDYREEIATNFLGGFLQMMSAQTGVQRGSSAAHANNTKLFRWYLADLVADAINDQIIPQFTDANFAGSPAYPKASLIGVDSSAILADLQIDDLLLGMGMELSKKDLYKRSGRMPPADGDDTLVKAAPPDPFGPLTDPNADPAAVIKATDAKVTAKA